MEKMVNILDIVVADDRNRTTMNIAAMIRKA